MNGNELFLGIVKLGQFHPLFPEATTGESLRLTEIQRQEAVSPESKEIALSDYEGRAIMVKGHSSSEWICSAEIIDEAGPILTTVVQKVFAY